MPIYMPKYSFDMTVGELLKDPKSREVFKKHVPALLNHPMLPFGKNLKLNEVLKYAKMADIDAKTIKIVKQELENLN